MLPLCFRPRRLPWLPLVVGLALSSSAVALAAPSPPAAPAGLINYRHHVLAIDDDGSAYWPTITRTPRPDGTFSYRTTLEAMPGEDTSSPTKPTNRKKGEGPRQAYYDYIDAMLANIAKRQPREIVIYIHGGMNSVDEAAAKGAWLADHLRETDPGIYPICVCWDSNLFRTYGAHLFTVRNGLKDPWVARATSPIFFASDFAASLARAPATWAKLIGSDIYGAYPQGFSRFQQAELRARYYRQTKLRADGPGVRSFRGRDDRSLPASLGDLAAYTLTQPTKLATAPFIDTMGVPAWRNMLRHTRTMFERESSFVRLPPPEDLDGRWSEQTVKQIREGIFLGRKGALRLFLERAQAQLATVQAQPYGHVTLVGHSMGTIIAGEMLVRFHGLRFDRVVFMAGASSVNDFRVKVIPYLEAQPKAKFWNLCLNERTERSTKVFYDIPPRGSLLVWIDSLFNDPPSEGDRTIGRWDNAVLAMDNLPRGVQGRVTVKSFGRDRPLHDYQAAPSYTDPAGDSPGRRVVAEPNHHEDFSHSDPRPTPKKPNFRFWSPKFRNPEVPEYDADSPWPPAKASPRRRARQP